MDEDAQAPAATLASTAAAVPLQPESISSATASASIAGMGASAIPVDPPSMAIPTQAVLRLASAQVPAPVQSVPIAVPAAVPQPIQTARRKPTSLQEQVIKAHCSGCTMPDMLSCTVRQ